MNYIYKTNLTKRFIASLLDYSFTLLVLYAYVELFGHDNAEGAREVTGFMLLPIPCFWLIYFVIVEASFGGTLFHLMLNLKVLMLNHNQIRFEQALARHLIDPIDFFWFGIPAIIAIKRTDKHQRIGDLWAKTIVVDTSDELQVPHNFR